MSIMTSVVFLIIGLVMLMIGVFTEYKNLQIVSIVPLFIALAPIGYLLFWYVSHFF